MGSVDVGVVSMRPPADALRAYQRLRTVLGDELGLEPGEEARRLEAAILAQDPLLNARLAVSEPTEVVEGSGLAGLPSGTVTFLFTDIKGSTRLWETDPAGMRLALAAHDEMVRAAVDAHDGMCFRLGGTGWRRRSPGPRRRSTPRSTPNGRWGRGRGRRPCRCGCGWDRHR